jgi:hypothetical protein
MRANRVFVILGGLGAIGALVAAHRANERRFRALEHELRVATQAREQAPAAASTEAVPRPVFVFAPPAAASPQTIGEAEKPDVSKPAPNSEADDRVREADQAAYVSMVFSQEAADPSWARDTERSIGNSLRGLADNSSLQGIECRRSLCKANLRHPDQTKFSDFVDRVVAHANDLWTGPIYSHRDAVGEDGVVQNTIYFGKQGTSIPSLE